MDRHRIVSTYLLLLASVAVGGNLPAADRDAFRANVIPMLRQHCVRCHGKDGETEGDVNLARVTEPQNLIDHPELLRDVVDAIESESMPPEDESRLESTARKELLAHLQALLRESIETSREFPSTPIRRMNRFQYNNAVQDLFELNVDVFPLPERMLRSYGYFRPDTGKMPDELKAGSRPLGKSQLIDKRLAGVVPFPQDLRAEHGFDNRGDHLSLSPLLLESFFQLSRSIIQSDDFNQKTCGIWNSFFAPPQQGSDIDDVIHERLRIFLTSAFRRPIDPPSLHRYAAHVRERMDTGDSYTDAMKAAASAALASPRFLYLYNRSSNDAKQESPDDFELASRLSFFLWGSIPDATLLELASQGTLSNRQVLASQVDRMLNDVRVKRFCDSFPAQWLQLERIVSSVPDRDRYPEFYFAKFRVSMHMMLEPLLLFETLLVEDRSILELIDSDFSYRSDMLESWYRNGTHGKKTQPTAIPFRRVEVTDRRQGGVITSAAVMTMTSGTIRTQPITRGAWIASVVFNDPPEPPPADVPPLPEDETLENDDLTLRERFAAHRNRADCASCHVTIDPLGFALENYGPTGVWREKYANGRTIDPSGVLLAQHKFSNVIEFKDSILAEKDRFAQAFAAHLLSFALGRDTGPADWASLESITVESADNGFRIRPLLKAIVLSEPFRQQGTSAAAAR